MFAQYIQPFVHQHGYWAVFLVVMLESAGVPLPGETALLAAAIYAGATGNLEIGWIVGLAALGAIIGDNIGFWAGRRFGLGLLLKIGPYIHVTQPRLKLGQYLFRLHGAKIVFFGRFVAVLRVFAALLAGVNQYEWRSFLMFNAAGGLVWASVFGFGGYIFGDAVHELAGPVAVGAFVLFVLGLIAFTWVARRQEAHWIALAEAAHPGPLVPDGPWAKDLRGTAEV